MYIVFTIHFKLGHTTWPIWRYNKTAQLTGSW